MAWNLVAIDGENITVVANGTAVGNKRIQLLPKGLDTKGITLVFKVVTAVYAPIIAHFGAYLGSNCE